MERKIVLPKGDLTEGDEELVLVDNLVIIGANGTGKSRLGSRIEHNCNDRSVKRISAQRLLSFNNVIGQTTFQEAQKLLLNNFRNNEVINPQNDYEILLTTICAETNKRNEDYVELCKSETITLKPKIPESAIEKLVRIWDSVLPHRQLSIVGNIANVKDGSNTYQARQMSDGEKVSLYLISQCLIVPENCIIIIDEPELHLHKSLMSRLWNKLEEERPDCIFIYITHDLDFAASRVRATKLWVKSYSLNKWDWEKVPDSDQIPENLLLEIIGSRKPILFVEGEIGSYDHAIYQFIYPDFTIIPRGNSYKVIESVRGIRENNVLHTINAFGLIDRDYKTDEEVTAIAKQGLFILDFAEVENLLLIPELIKAVARNQANDEETELGKIKQFVLEELKKDFDRIVSYRTSLIVNFKLNAFDKKQIGEANVKKAINSLVSSIDVSHIYKENYDLYKKILDNSIYEDALKYYNNKGLLPQVSKLLGLANGQYVQLILRLLNVDDRRSEIITSLKKHLPQIK